MGRHRRPRSQRRRRVPAGGLHAGPPQGRRASSAASRAAASPRGAATSPPPTAGRRDRVRCGATRPTTQLQARRARAALRLAARPGARTTRTRHRVSPRGGVVLCEDGESEDIDGRKTFDPRAHPRRRDLQLRRGDREDAAAQQLRRDLFPRSTSAAGTVRRARGRSAPRRPRASASAPTASGCSSTSSIRVRRSRSPGPGTRVGSEPARARDCRGGGDRPGPDRGALPARARALRRRAPAIARTSRARRGVAALGRADELDDAVAGRLPGLLREAPRAPSSPTSTATSTPTSASATPGR